jgi:dipeptidyl aminopeptidase/acylaminoacyl peptidase
MEAEFGLPQWLFDGSAFTSLPDGRLACTWSLEGRQALGLLDPHSGRLERIELPYTSFVQLRSQAMTLAVLTAGPRDHDSVVTLDLDHGVPAPLVLRRAFELEIEPASISVPEPVEFPTDGGLTAHGLFYAPTNRDFTGLADERPPLLVLSHGGPTGNAEPILDAGVQFWTSRGFAIVDVNYGGSTGYGRAYRERLNGQWGVVDVADCVNAARFLADSGRVDPRRMAIRGGSAGGYTTLCALTFYDLFAAGASYFGVADLVSFTRETHKFESRYLDSLVGPYPEAADLYRERSPANFADRLSCPIIMFQGLEDKVVPPSQAEVMLAALRAKGIPHAYLAFEGEQHGFRRAETIQATREAELSFYARIFGFEPADPIEPVAIHGMDG